MSNFKAGDKVWVLCSWVDEDCWVEGEVLKTTAKRIQVFNHIRSAGYYKPENVKFPESP
jgi:hypothetical protein